jgi:hypothetical protein
MRYLRTSFYAKKGQAVKVTFDQPAKIMLMSDRDFKKYKNNSGTISYQGGLVKESPLVLEISSAGTWHVIVELGWYDKKQIDASVDLLNELPPEYRPVREIDAPGDEESVTAEETTEEAEA